MRYSVDLCWTGTAQAGLGVGCRDLFRYSWGVIVLVEGLGKVS